MGPKGFLTLGVRLENLTLICTFGDQASENKKTLSEKSSGSHSKMQ